MMNLKFKWNLYLIKILIKILNELKGELQTVLMSSRFPNAIIAIMITFATIMPLNDWLNDWLFN